MNNGRSEKQNVGFLKKLLDGADVGWVRLGDLSKYEQPTKYLVKSSNYNNKNKTPVLTAGKTFVLGYTDEEDGVYKASKRPVIIFDDFTTDSKWVDFDFKAKSSAMKMITTANEGKVLTKYIYYWLNTIPSNTTESDHKRHWISNYCKKRIPIPCPNDPEKSLAIQSEIVRILDKFTELTAELTAELIARKKQYQYYRNLLLSEEELGKVGFEWKALGDICHLKNGYTPSKTNKKFWENGTIPWYRMEDIRTNGRILSKSIQHVSKDAVKKGGLIKKNSLIMSTTATLGEHALVTEPFLTNQQITSFTLRETYNNSIKMKYLFHYFFIFGEWCGSKANKSGGLLIIPKSKLAQFKVPVPPVKEQNQIVSILDKFETLANSISEGLPREIELRRKQYEYYRNMLFDFPKPKE